MTARETELIEAARGVAGMLVNPNAPNTPPSAFGLGLDAGPMHDQRTQAQKARDSAAALYARAHQDECDENAIARFEAALAAYEEEQG